MRFWDASAVVPLCVEEESTQPMRDLLATDADVAIWWGTPVEAAAAGRVVLAEDLYFYGNLVILDHGGGVYTLYAHLSEISVAEGDSVESGQLIGLSGATGRVTGPHLHWGAKIGNRPFDPTALLDGALFRK